MKKNKNERKVKKYYIIFFSSVQILKNFRNYVYFCHAFTFRGLLEVIFAIFITCSR